MPPIPTKTRARLQSTLKRYQTILTDARARDVNEADTVTIVIDTLTDVLGFDKYTEITSEYAIKSTFVDLAIKLDSKPTLLIEVKPVGVELDDKHTRQAVDYAANLGVEWVALTNGDTWRVYRVTFGKPIGQELVLHFNLTHINPRTVRDQEKLFPITREGLLKMALHQEHEQKQATNRFILAAILQSDPVLDVIRREIRRLSPNVLIEREEVKTLLIQDVIKRDIADGEAAEEARQKVKRAASRTLRNIPKNKTRSAPAQTPDPPTT